MRVPSQTNAFAKLLQAGKRDFLEAASGASREPATAGSWSVAECIEHVILFEERCLQWLADAPVATPRRDSAKELRLFTAIRSRLMRLQTVDVLRPAGRVSTIEDALASFTTVRDRSLQLVLERDEELYAIAIKHPYFGRVNGAELIQLMDGHARRHADQIRELSTAVVRKEESLTKPAHRKKDYEFKRDVPDLPVTFEEEQSDCDFVDVESRHVQGVERPNLRIGNCRLEGSLFERVKLAGGEFGALVCKDVRFIGCDLSNVRAHRMTLVRVELIDCRLSGLHATALDWQDVLIRNGDVRYAQLQSGKFRSCEFDGCKWQEVDLQGADLTGSRFRSCEFGQADLRGATLLNADFRTSQVEGLQVELHNLKGAIVDAGQAMLFARLLGLRIF